MSSTISKHAGGGFVAAAIVAAALLEGAFEPDAYATASIVVWCVVLAGLVSRVLPTGPVSRTAAVAGAFLAGLVILAGASVAWAGDQGRAFDEAVRASFYLGLFTLAASTATRSGRAQWLGGLAAGLGLVAAVTVVSYLQPGLLDDNELERLIPGAEGRLSYPLGYWNGTGALLAVAAILLAHCAAEAPDRRLRTLAAAVAPVALLGVWLTSSRGAAAAALLGLVLLLAVPANRPRQLLVLLVVAASSGTLIGCAEALGGLDGAAAERGPDGDTMTTLLAAVVALTGAAAWLLDGRTVQIRLSRAGLAGAAGLAAIALFTGIALADPIGRFDEFRAPPPGLELPGSVAASEDVSSSGRWQFWTEALDAWGSAPVAGIGAGAYEDYWAQHGTISVFVRNPHSLPLQELAEQGLVGLMLLLGVAVAVALAAWRWLASRPAGPVGAMIAVVAATAASALIDWTWQIPAATAPALVAAGLLTASAPGRKLGEGRYWLGLATIGFAWIALLAGALAALEQLKLERSRQAAAAGEVSRAIERAEEARTVQPFSPEPYTQLALLEEARGDLDEALERLAEARRRDSEDWRLALIEARLHRARGDEPAAQRSLAEARELNPLFQLTGGSR